MTIVFSYRGVMQRHEGFCPHAYRDTLGYWTIGYGRLIDERRGGGLSRAEADYLLGNDLQKAETVARSLFQGFDQFSASRQCALVSMAFNLGPRGLRGFQKMRAAIAAGDWADAARQALDSKWAKQVPHRATEIAGWLKAGE